MRRHVLALVLVALAAVVPPAHATVGGESLVEMLGWDPAAKQVYFHELAAGESDDGRVIRLSLDGEHAGELHVVPWERERRGAGPADDLDGCLAELRARLRPLRPATWQTLPLRTEVVASDSVPNEFGRTDRLRVRVHFGSQLSFEVTTWGSTSVSRVAAYEIPGRPEQVWVLAFVGDPFETGYETQLPLLVRRGEKGMRVVEWKRLPDE